MASRRPPVLASTGLEPGRDTPVTLLLTDVEGSSVLWERAPDAMGEALQRVDRLVDEAVNRHHGRVLKARAEGDSHFAVFDEPAEARAAAADLQDALDAEPWATPEPLRLRMAIARGSAREHQLDLVGPIVNRTARLRSLAVGGQVLVGETAASGPAPKGWVLVDLGVHELPRLGVRERVHELRRADLMSVPTGARSTLGWIPTGTGDLVGRLNDLALLDAAMARAFEGERRLVLITGEAGIGKTRLVGEAVRGVADTDALVLFGRCVEGSPVPFAPFVEALGALARSMPEAELRLQLGPSSADVARVVPAVAARIVEGRLGGSPIERVQVFDAVDRWLQRLASIRPIVLVLDDLQWADGDTLALLAHVLGGLDAMRCCVIATVRIGEPPGLGRLGELLARLGRDDRLDRLELGGLTEEEVAALATAPTGPSGLTSVDPTWLRRRTDGNPFFVLELVRHLDSDQAAALPATLLEVVTSRIARLGDTTVDVLGTAALVGAVFPVGLVEEVTGDAALLDRLDAAVRAQLLRELPGDRLAFVHGVVHQALVDRMTFVRRRRIHARVAEIVAERPERWGMSRLDVAFHQCAAAPVVAPVVAASTALLAAADAVERSAFETAAAVLERAVDVLEPVPGEEALRATVLLAFARVRYPVGDRVGGDAAVRQAAGMALVAGRNDLVAEAALALGGLLGGMNEPDVEVLGLIDRAIAAAGDDDGLVAELLARRAVWSALSSDRRDVEETTRRAVELARASGRPQSLAVALEAQLECTIGPATVADLAGTADELIELAERLDEQALLAQALRLRASTAVGLGDLQTAGVAVEALEKVAERTGYLLPAMWCDQFRMTRAGLQGAWDDAEASYQAVARRLRGWRSPQRNLVIATAGAAWDWFRGRPLREIGALERLVERYPSRAPWRLLLALARAIDGRVADARTLLEQQVTEARPIVVDSVWGPTIASWAAAAAFLDDADHAAAVRDELAAYPDAMCWAGMSTNWGPARLYLGMVTAVAGDPAAAVEHLERARSVAEGLGARPHAALADAWLARCLTAQGQEDDAASRAERALAVARELDLGLVARTLEPLPDSP
jgi:class 3 adenylate cyclase